MHALESRLRLADWLEKGTVVVDDLMPAAAAAVPISVWSDSRSVFLRFARLGEQVHTILDLPYAQRRMSFNQSATRELLRQHVMRGFSLTKSTRTQRICRKELDGCISSVLNRI